MEFVISMFIILDASLGSDNMSIGERADLFSHKLIEKASPLGNTFYGANLNKASSIIFWATY